MYLCLRNPQLSTSCIGKKELETSELRKLEIKENTLENESFSARRTRVQQSEQRPLLGRKWINLTDSIQLLQKEVGQQKQ